MVIDTDFFTDTSYVKCCAVSVSLLPCLYGLFVLRYTDVYEKQTE